MKPSDTNDAAAPICMMRCVEVRAEMRVEGAPESGRAVVLAMSQSVLAGAVARRAAEVGCLKDFPGGHIKFSCDGDGAVLVETKAALGRQIVAAAATPADPAGAANSPPQPIALTAEQLEARLALFRTEILSWLKSVGRL